MSSYKASTRSLSPKFFGRKLKSQESLTTMNDKENKVQPKNPKVIFSKLHQASSFQYEPSREANHLRLEPKKSAGSILASKSLKNPFSFNRKAVKILKHELMGRAESGSTMHDKAVLESLNSLNTDSNNFNSKLENLRPSWNISKLSFLRNEKLLPEEELEERKKERSRKEKQQQEEEELTRRRIMKQESDRMKRLQNHRVPKNGYRGTQAPSIFSICGRPFTSFRVKREGSEVLSSHHYNCDSLRFLCKPHPPSVASASARRRPLPPVLD